jgi:hypothetical protein
MLLGQGDAASVRVRRVLGLLEALTPAPQNARDLYPSNRLKIIVIAWTPYVHQPLCSETSAKVLGLFALADARGVRDAVSTEVSRDALIIATSHGRSPVRRHCVGRRLYQRRIWCNARWRRWPVDVKWREL